MSKESYYFDKVEEFNKIFEKDLAIKTPGFPPPERAKFIGDMIEEELEEYRRGVERGDIVEVADALADLLYFLADGVLCFGLKDKFKEIFDEVHSSNLSKACQTIEEAYKSKEAIEKKEEEKVYITQTAYIDPDTKEAKTLYVLKRCRDDKVRKGLSFYEPNLLKILSNG